MGLSTDTSNDFDVADAATYLCFDDPTDLGVVVACDLSAKIEFVAPGKARIIAGNEDTYAVLTPSIDISGAGWSYIHHVEITAPEAVGYYHRILASFDGGGTFNTYGSGGWRAVRTSGRTLPEIAEDGLSLDQIQAINDWPDPADIGLLGFAVFMTRDSGGGTGAISQINVSYMPTATDFKVTELPGEPDGSDTLPTGGAGQMITPEFPIDWKTIRPGLEMRTEGGYEIAANLSSTTRRAASIKFRPANEADKDTLLTFIFAHQDVAFVWTPPGFLASKKFVFGDPEVEALEQIDAGAFEVRCSIMEVLPI